MLSGTRESERDVLVVRNPSESRTVVVNALFKSESTAAGLFWTEVVLKAGTPSISAESLKLYVMHTFSHGHGFDILP